MRRKARKSGGKMKAGTCKRARNGLWLCKSKTGKVRFSRTKKY